MTSRRSNVSDVFGISVSALQAFQHAINVTSNNVANASTPGYDRETVNLTEAIPQSNGAATIGAGVVVSGINRAFSQAAANQLNTSQSSLGQLNALQNYTSQIDNLFGTTVGGLEHRAAELLQRLFRCGQQSNLHGIAPGADRSGAKRRQQLSKRQRRAQLAEHGRQFAHHRRRDADQFHRQGDLNAEQSDRDGDCAGRRPAAQRAARSARSTGVQPVAAGGHQHDHRSAMAP